ncbi:hypothetical protein BD289DRAFT_277962 [Coniella lustricola]|uniref:Uncharacterized protein n=1 Tax=Coniella lustricola TaxID=2025994 RepID=A0A2T3A6A6_9PEZI|nr:hypothetical protein BD289DRAFT_277962 [Coniella lustricola]
MASSCMSFGDQSQVQMCTTTTTTWQASISKPPASYDQPQRTMRRDCSDNNNNNNDNDNDNNNSNSNNKPSIHLAATFLLSRPLAWNFDVGWSRSQWGSLAMPGAHLPLKTAVMADGLMHAVSALPSLMLVTVRVDPKKKGRLIHGVEYECDKGTVRTWATENRSLLRFGMFM